MDRPAACSNGEDVVQFKFVSDVQQIGREWNEGKQCLEDGIHVARVAEIVETATPPTSYVHHQHQFLGIRCATIPAKYFLIPFSAMSAYIRFH